jgi:tRNA 5-methylaminomethyl-2-thiouridine biosynthesis bifunctional protein
MVNQKQTPAWFRYPQYNWESKHAVVIGAGIAGCQIAWHLVQVGWQVTLIEREQKIAQQASGNPAGIISPKMTAQSSAGEDFYVSCFDYAIKQLTSLKNSHQSLDWHACGLLQLAHNAREELRWESLENRNFDQSFLQLLDQNQSTDIAGIPLNYKASYFPQAGWINPVSFCEVLLTDCESKDSINVSGKLNVILETDVINLVRQNESEDWQLCNQQGKIIASAEAVIITSGKDLNQFSQTKNLPSIPVAGQTTTATSNDFASQLKSTIGHEGYLTPVSDTTSQLTFGASFERNINDTELNTETDKNNLEQLSKYLPQLADSFVDINSAHAAIRMTTPDRFPYFGGIADQEYYTNKYSDLHQGKQYKEYPNAKYIGGLFVLAGLGSRGLTTSGLCAKVLSDVLNNASNTDFQSEDHCIQQYCHPARYLIKDLKRNKKEKV